MGNCCPCFKSNTHIYEKIPENNNNIEQENRRKSLELPSNNNNNYNNYNNNNLSSHLVQLSSNNLDLPVNQRSSAKISISFDPNAMPFKGSEVLQKFNNNQTYSKRFVWLNYESKTIHMSQYMTKERRHKEASLCDVTSVVAGPPIKKKSQFNDNSNDLCLTVNFKRGGGIDLQFKTKEDRDSWYSTLLNIVAELDRNKV